MPPSYTQTSPSGKPVGEWKEASLGAKIATVAVLASLAVYALLLLVPALGGMNAILGR